MADRLNENLQHLLLADAYRYTGKADNDAIRSAYRQYPGYRFSYHLRKVASYAHRKGSIFLVAYAYHRFWLNRYRFRYGFDISPTTIIGPGLFIGHFGGVVISPDAVLGSNINIAQGVTIGSTSRGDRAGTPTLRDRVWVGANAILVGKIEVGEDSLIAPGAYVNFDVPSRSIVLGNPGKIVSHKGSFGYINNLMDSSLAK